METPCVDICILDDASGLCVGCGRSGDEIARWVDMTPSQRQVIMSALPERLKQLQHENQSASIEPPASGPRACETAQ